MAQGTQSVLKDQLNLLAQVELEGLNPGLQGDVFLLELDHVLYLLGVVLVAQ